MLVQRNYIAAKELEELSAITRATTVLEDELKRADEAFEPAVTEFKNQYARVRDEYKGKPATAAARSAASGPAQVMLLPRPAAPPLELTSKLNELRNEERAVLEPWQRRTAELKFQLADLRAVYGPAHPAVVALENKLRSASAEPVELLDIRQRQADLKASIAGFASGEPGRVGSLSAGRPAAASEAAGPARDGLSAKHHRRSQPRSRAAAGRVRAASIVRDPVAARCRAHGARHRAGWLQVSLPAGRACEVLGQTHQPEAADAASGSLRRSAGSWGCWPVPHVT